MRQDKRHIATLDFEREETAFLTIICLLLPPDDDHVAKGYDKNRQGGLPLSSLPKKLTGIPLSFSSSRSSPYQHLNLLLIPIPSIRLLGNSLFILSPFLFSSVIWCLSSFSPTQHLFTSLDFLIYQETGKEWEWEGASSGWDEYSTISSRSKSKWM